MFLDSEPKPLNQDIAISIPPLPKAEEPVSTAPPAIAGMPVAPQPAEPAPAPSAPATPAPAAVPETLPPVAATRPEPKPEPKPKPAAKPVPAAAAADGFVVQLGAFSNAANARALQKKLQENKFKAYTELVKSSGGDRTRVRVGPYPSREAADKARDQLKSRRLVIGEATVVRQGE
jgi:DedD protein